MISPSQILLSAIIIFILARTIIAYKRKDLSKGFVLVWIVFWLAGLFFIFQQNFISGIAYSLGISRGVDLVIYLALILIFYVLYKLLDSIAKIERTITQIVRRMAIKESDKKEKR